MIVIGFHLNHFLGPLLGLQFLHFLDLSFSINNLLLLHGKTSLYFLLLTLKLFDLRQKVALSVRVKSIFLLYLLDLIVKVLLQLLVDLLELFNLKFMLNTGRLRELRGLVLSQVLRGLCSKHLKIAVQSLNLLDLLNFERILLLLFGNLAVKLLGGNGMVLLHG